MTERNEQRSPTLRGRMLAGLARVLQVVLLVVTLLVAVVAGALIVTQTGWFHRWLRGTIEQQGDKYLNGRLTVGAVEGTILSGLALTDLRVTMNGQSVISLGTLDVRYDPLKLLTGNLTIDSVRLDHPVVQIAREHGRLNLSTLLRPRPSNGGGPRRAFAVDDIRIVNATVTLPAHPVGTAGRSGSVIAPERFDDVNARLSFASTSSGYVADIDRISLHAREPDLDLDGLSGTIAVRGTMLSVKDLLIRTTGSSLRIDGTVEGLPKTPSFNLAVDGRPVDLAEIGRLIPTLTRFRINPSFDVSVTGPLGAMHLDFRVRSGASGVESGNLVLDARAPDHHLSGTVHLRDFDMNPYFPPTSEHHSNVTGVARVSIGFVKGRTGTDLHGPFRLQAEHAEGFGYGARNVDAAGRIDATELRLDRVDAVAYGSPVRTAGTIQLPHEAHPVAYDLHGHVAGVDLRLLPRSLRMPRVPSKLTLDYHVAGIASRVHGNGRLDRSVFTGATVEPGTTAQFSYDGTVLSYSGDGALGHFDLREFGRAFAISALEPARYASDVSGRFRVSGSGTTLRALNLTGEGILGDSSLFQIQFPAGEFHVGFANQALSAAVRGRFARLDPAQVVEGTPRPPARRPWSGELNGDFDLSVEMRQLGVATHEFSFADDMSVAGRIGLQSSTLARVHIDRAQIDGRYANRAAEVNRFDAESPVAHLQVSGPLVLNDIGQSKLTYRAETGALDRIGDLIARPMSGALTLDGVLSGNASDLKTSGTLKGSNVTYGSFQALDVNGPYEVELPHLDATNLVARATTRATFVTVEGLQIDSVIATTAYAANRLGFDVDAREPKRRMNATGEIGLQPAREELRFQRLALQSGGVTWQLASGSQPVIGYADDTLRVSGATLTSGDQAISISGAIGRAKSDLEVRADNVSLANIDALMLTNRRIGGVLDGQATITGPRDALRAGARFSVTRGSFRQFAYQSLTGTLAYAASRIGIDARLEESPGAWFTIDGSVPTAIFRRNPAAPAADEPVNLQLHSSRLDLALVQGFTTALRDVKGSVAIDAQATGTAAKPRLAGQLTLDGGSFTVAPTGVHYAAMTARLALHDDRLSVQDLSLSDPAGNRLTATGDLALGEQPLPNASLHVRSGAFEVIDNAIAKSSLALGLTVDGSVRQPRVTGTIGVDSARVNADRLIEAATGSPYSTSPEAVPAQQPPGPTATQVTNQPARTAETRPAAPVVAPQEATPASAAASSSGGFLDGVSLDLHVTMPNDVVVRGSDIRIGQSRVSFGKVDVTLGGDVHVDKQADSPLRLLGAVTTVRGTYQFQGRRFDIRRGGEIRFEGLPRINPALDITATRAISGVEARVHLGGSLRRPDLTLASDPPLDQADVLSLIIFGQPANQLATGQQASLTQTATAIASGFVASQLTQSISRVLNLDTFTIESAETAGQLGATITLGEQIGQRLYVRVRQSLGVANLREFVLDYQLTDFLRLETTMSQGTAGAQYVIRRIGESGQSGADLIFFFSF